MRNIYNIAIGLIFCLVFLTGCGQEPVQMTAKEDMESSIEPAEMVANTEAEPEQIYVYVCGHVNEPGVYKLAGDARVCDALELAGGVSEEGNPEGLNQAERMEDGQTIYVPGIGEAIERQDAAVEDGMININLAGKEELMTLPGIGESKAISIIQYREEQGMFQSIEGLMEIPGIKEKLFNKIKDKIKV